jgi:hypothetical protein
MCFTFIVLMKNQVNIYVTSYTNTQQSKQTTHMSDTLQEKYPYHMTCLHLISCHMLDIMLLGSNHYLLLVYCIHILHHIFVHLLISTFVLMNCIILVTSHLFPHNIPQSHGTNTFLLLFVCVHYVIHVIMFVLVVHIDSIHQYDFVPIVVVHLIWLSNVMLMSNVDVAIMMDITY